MKRRGDMTFVMQAVLWAAIIAIIGGLVYLYIVKPGTAPLPGADLLP